MERYTEFDRQSRTRTFFHFLWREEFYLRFIFSVENQNKLGIDILLERLHRDNVRKLIPHSVLPEI